MKVTGIIAEYNPFHNGHKYHMEKSRELTGADFVVVVMSGNYVQRGLPAVIDKYERTKMALECGADLVLELPLPYATASAEYFATGAVSLLHKLGVVDSLCFGSECGDASLLLKVAKLLVTEPLPYKETLQKYLVQGLSFPSAQEAAVFACTDNGTAALLSSPNNRLGIEYCKALLRMESNITPVSILRRGGGYHDETLYSDASTPSSASAIRKAMENAKCPDDILSQVPQPVAGILQKEWNKSFPVTENDLSLLLHYKLLLETKESLQTYFDVTPDFADKILKCLPEYTTFSNFCLLLKSKELTYSRISRCLLHILLDIKTAHIENYRSLEITPYARILGFRKESSELLHEIKTRASIPMISKLADAHKILEPAALEMLQREITAGHIYEAVKANKFMYSAIIPQSEYTREIIIV
ncbi:MAG: nucleotidyltransferase [Lachnospiraceae bacterium]|nr:nucleotidyltransferase [Lachnospiraceae bacterium]